ncbi:aminoacyl-histidine dipeptidase [Catenovulum sp. SM1970]|uniref:aminoacyl-histidine dipeptidase n=1 Tax=Marinifaba aquimaris TaxID=2741323 RepID=UPI001573D76D|nr:aminoacyl-histidine dipeptidase [Marinifaba aquimaris]NTS76417.1 aminoacyl-histidine dipeptidase [Marinifaba aquimaris]
MSSVKLDKKLADLSPKPLWNWFQQICDIPHPSKHEAKLKAHIQAWADNKGITCVEDNIGNLILRKPASQGMEDRKTVVIQAHLDMVPQANSDTPFNFETDAILPYVVEDTDTDGTTDEWVKATGTTLGSDNGIGMASALAVLEADDIAHPKLEVLLTVDEEAGMTGAFGLEAGTLEAEILINTDSEQEGEVYMGCAGGCDAQVTVPVEYQAAQAGLSYSLAISGLKGGHSGCNIHMGRGNAIKLLSRFAYGHHVELGLQLTSITGGTLRNAIPREAQMQFVIAEDKKADLEQALETFKAIIDKEYAIAEGGIELSLTPADAPEQVFTQAAQAKLLAFLHASPNGVTRMSDEIEGVTETSLNLGVLTITDTQAQALFLVRSLDDNARDGVVNSLAALAELTGAEFESNGAYPGWKPDNSSPVMAIVRDVYDGLYGHKPNIMVIHAGLECGLFKEPYPEMDMVSIGPTIRFPHSPDEKVNVRTVGLYWQLLLAVLENIPSRNS